MKKCMSLILCLSLFVGLIAPLTAYADEESEYSLINENIEVYVSAENGGFAIKTAEGDTLKKSDNNIYCIIAENTIRLSLLLK